MNDTDRDIDCLHRVSREDSSAIAELYDRYTTSLLYPVALRIVGDPAEAEEAVQEAWVQAWHSAATYDARRGTVAAWLLTITRSRSLDRMRAVASKRRREINPGAADRPEPAANQDTSAALQDRERQVSVRSALDSLESHHRQVLEIAYFDGLSQSGIARRLDVPLGTIKSWTRQALGRLRTKLESEGRL